MSETDNSGPLRLVAPDQGANAARRRQYSRRTFVGVSLAAGLAVGLGGRGSAAAAATGHTSPSWTGQDPFRLGVASGDPTPDGVVLWTRLAIDPLAEDGAGGMPSQNIDVSWQLARDPQFRHIVRSGVAPAVPEWAHSVHVEVEGLQPGHEYWYRFRVGGHLSPVGRTLTSPAPGNHRDLHAVAVSCSHYEGGYFTAYRHAAEENPDVVFELGDYIYEGAGVAGRFRVHPGSTCVSLAQYRARYALYKNEPETQQLHAAAPWIVTWDDHEVQDNWAGVYDKNGVPSDAFAARRAAAAKAYYENMPLRRASIPNGPDIKLYRRLRWGSLADIHVLDERSFRDRQAGNTNGSTWWFSNRKDEYNSPNRTILGAEQRAWLLDGLRQSRATWQILPQGVFFAKRDITAGPVETLGSDGWDGYGYDRDSIRDTWAARRHNAVVLTGDVHMHFANEIKADFANPDSATVGVELVTTSVTSGDDGSDTVNGGATVLAENPHIKFIQNRRGYVRMKYTRDELRSDFMSMPYVQRPDAPISAAASFVTPAGAPAMHRV
ncbi:alkaline phosphatase [Planosporangium flavigriseum]|uniref:Alkaline phosphatase n=1 Tax=Planosporangium flavigriseum TaxID=373681 RepID=A0A8J3PMI0_9ACTN|nr:alkaline phosphatase D family protein [Planosporangium flavigriseum]NJC67433.1 alkaline phosphatase [Planosporangium flavigriseum]GIG74927.1 alkaline phosphatase [Planosporangium flavigriseum]